ncbi:MAG TPA: hypothetical protein VND42_00030, partial [Candidatus Acidoferrales bacterium]|nr:hypothetical protein [Candidatus Acidoferrales bacterium]
MGRFIHTCERALTGGFLMRKWLAGASSLRGRIANRFTNGVAHKLMKTGAASAALAFLSPAAAYAQSAPEAAGGEANLKVPDLSQVSFLGVNGHNLL